MEDLLTVCCGVASWHCFGTDRDQSLSGWWFCKHELQEEKQKRACLNRNGSHGFVTAYGRDTCSNEFSPVLPVTISRLRQHVRTQKTKHSFSFIICF